MDEITVLKSALTDLLKPIIENAVKAALPSSGEKERPRYITIKEACAEYKLTSSTIYRRFDEGTFSKIKNGGRTLLDREEIESTLEKQQLGGIQNYPSKRR